MFDQPFKPNTNKDFPNRTWVGVSCANPACSNYGKTDVRCLKAGKDKKNDRQRYKCKRCKKTFYPLEPPKGKFRINRNLANGPVEAKPEEDLKTEQPKQEKSLNEALGTEEVQAKPEADLKTEQPEQEKQAQRKQVSFLLTYKAAQGLYKVCDFLGIESRELLEQIGQGTLEVRFARKEIKLSSEAMAMLKQHQDP